MQFVRHTWLLLVVLYWHYAVAAPLCRAGGGPENVLLVVNSNSQDSMTVANHYISLRGIPHQNVFYLPYKGRLDYANSEEYRKKILLPILEEIDQRKLGGQVDYIVYSCDFPWKIGLKKDFPKEEFGISNAPYASLSGATYLWPFIKEKRKEITGFVTNYYYVEQRAALLSSRAFRSQYRWAPGGRRTRQGLAYMISSMLGVTNGRGNTVGEIIRSLENSKQSDGTSPSGMVYFMKHSGKRSEPRHDLFKDTATELRRLGVEAKVLEGKFPLNKTTIAGITCGTSHVNMKTAGSKFLPGAFCDNLTSYGAVLTKPKKLINPKTGKKKVLQVSVCDFIRAGATGACGTVHEPTNAWPKFPQSTLHLHYARGCSIGESFYQATAGPYQQLLIGDPLCQPWAVEVKVEVPEIGRATVLKGTVEITPKAVLPDTRQVAFYDFYVNGERKQRIRPGMKFKLDTTTLGDGYHELRVVATENSPIETQGRWVSEVKIKNGRDAVQLTVDKNKLNKGTKFLAVKATSTNGKPVAVIHNGRELGRVEERSGTTQIPIEKLGSGPVALYGLTEGEPAIRSQSLKVVLP